MSSLLTLNQTVPVTPLTNLHRKLSLLQWQLRLDMDGDISGADYLANCHHSLRIQCAQTWAVPLEKLSTSLLPWLQYKIILLKEMVQTLKMCLNAETGRCWYYSFTIKESSEVLWSFWGPQLLMRCNRTWKMHTLQARERTSSTLCSGLRVNATPWPSQKCTYVCVSHAPSFWMLSGTEQ